MKNTNEIRNTKNNTTEINTNAYSLDEFDTSKGGKKPTSIHAMRRKVAFIQRKRRMKARKQRIAAFAVTASVAVAAIATFCIFGIPAINKQANAPAPATASVSTQAKKTSADKNKTNTDRNTDSNTLTSDNNAITYNDTYTNDAAATYTNTNTFVDSSTVSDSDSNVVQPYIDNSSNAKIADDKNDVAPNKVQTIDNGINIIDNNKPADNAVNTAVTANDNGSEENNVVQPFIG